MNTNTVGNAFSYVFRDPEWITKILLQGLIALIPIIGWIALYGWVLKTMDNLNQGVPELAPAGFHLSRGVQLFVPGLVWGIVLVIPIIIFQIIIALNTSYVSDPSGESIPTGVSLAGRIFEILLTLWALLIFLICFILGPSLWVNTWRRGMAGGFQISEIFKLAFGNFTDSLVAAVLMVVSGFVAIIGLCCCLVGWIFTLPLAEAFLAGILFWFARQTGSGPSVPETPGPGGSPTEGGPYPDPVPPAPPTATPPAASPPPAAAPPEPPSRGETLPPPPPAAG